MIKLICLVAHANKDVTNIGSFAAYLKQVEESSNLFLPLLTLLLMHMRDWQVQYNLYNLCLNNICRHCISERRKKMVWLKLYKIKYIFAGGFLIEVL